MNKPFDAAKERLSAPMTYGVEPYVSPEFIELERDRMWRKVWLEAGRVEEIPNVGDFISYEILDDSVLIVRASENEIKAYHNVCVHRGRRLVDIPGTARNAEGRTRQFVCGYHGWQYNLAGENTHIENEQDWQGQLTKECTSLKPVSCDTWGGWIWINLDRDCEPLRDYLEPAGSLLDPFRMEDMRYKWRRWAVFDCNWKVAIEAFIETYHVPVTHPEFMAFGSYTGWGRLEGKHAVIGYDAPGENKGRIRLGSREEEGKDPRTSTAEMVDFIMKNVKSNFTQSLWDAAMRLEEELPEGTPEAEVLKHWVESAKKADAAQGVIWPVLEPEHFAKAGMAWNIFPNFRLGHAVNNGLCYQARPYGHDPDKCIFEVSVLELFPKGQEPETEWIHTPIDDIDGWGSVLTQDFGNMAAVQQGMKSFAFDGPMPNPKEEGAVTALHRVLADYLGTEAPRPLKK